MDKENKLAREVTQRLMAMMKHPLTRRFCLKIDGRFSNSHYEAGMAVPINRQVNPMTWAIDFELHALSVEPDGTVVYVPGEAARRCPSAEDNIRVYWSEENLLPWNLMDNIMWPKYPHLFQAHTLPDSSWLEICEVRPWTPSVIEYPVRNMAVKLHKGVCVLPVGVMENAEGEPCYAIAVEAGTRAFDSFLPTALIPISEFIERAIPINDFDVAGWAA